MIVSRTPFRMSFVGGGTDLPVFYEKHQGAVISTAIDKYIYLTVIKHFESTTHVRYSQTETVENLSDIKHDRFREAMKQVGVEPGLYITSISDIPAGTGLGSSSSFTVGLFNALHKFYGRHQTPWELAEQACNLEINILRAPIGKQDQYAAAFGGLRRYLFNPDGSVLVDVATCSPARINCFYECLMLFYVGGTRDASQVLTGVKATDSLYQLRKLVDIFWSTLTSYKDLRELGEVMDYGWQCKKKVTDGVSNSLIDGYYDTARKAGALGGKLLGAGGTGFLLLFCEPDKQDAVRIALANLRRMDFNFSSEGSKIIYAG